MAVYGPYPATVTKVHDGDTITCRLSLGFDVYTEHPCRLLAADGRGIDAPELSTAAGKAALAFVLTLVKVGDQVVTISHGYDAYNPRYDGSITLADGSDLAVRMVEAGHAVWKTFK